MAKGKSSKEETKEAYSNFSSKLEQIEKEDKTARKSILKKGVKDREGLKKSSGLQSKVIRSKISSVREEADLSAFVDTSGKIKSPKFRRKEFRKLLSREVLLIGTEEWEEQGGIVSLSALKDYFRSHRDNWKLREGDVMEACEYLLEKDLIVDIAKQKESAIIFFKPIELSSDIQTILFHASHNTDLTFSTLRDVLGWQDERVTLALDQLEKLGLLLKDGPSLFFPGI